MALAIKDRVKETTTTTSTGTYTLAGAVTGFETFTANLSNGDTTYYACTDNTDFEVGIGTFTSSGTTLARTTILASSNSNNAVNWSSGTRTIFMTYPADKAVFKDASDNINGTFVGNITGNVTGNTSGTAATVTTAAQSNITSLGTLTTLTVDNIIINGTTIGHATDDTDLITLADGIVTVAGEISVTTLDIGGTNVTSTAAELNVLDGIASIDTDISSVSGSDDTLASAKAIKTYVDAKVTAEDLDVTSDSGTIAIDLDSETLTIAGGSGIDTSATSNTVTIAGEDATTSNKGVASFSSDNFAVSSGAVTIKDGGVVTAELADDAVTADKLASDAVVNASVASGAAIAVSKTALTAGTGISLSTNTLNVDAAQTGITSLLATDIKIGEDDQTKIDFETADTINFYAGNEKQLILTDGALTPGADNILDLGSSGVEFKDAFFDGTVTSDAFAGPLTGDVTGNADTATALATARTIGGTSFDGTGNISVALATLATTVTITDNEDTDEDNAIIFTAGGDVDGGDLGLESDGTLTYNPSTGTVTATIFKGNIDAVDGDFDGTLEADAITIGGTGIGSIYSAIAGSSSIVTTGALNSGSITSGFGTIDTGSSAITTTGLISGGSLDIDDVVINGTTIGHTDDTDLITVADGLLSVAGDLTIISTAGGDGDNPSLVLYRNSGSPADSDDLAEILFRGRNDNSQDVEYAKIWAEAQDVSDGTEDGRLTFQLMNNGSLQSRLDFRGGSRTRFFNQDVELSTGVDLIFEGATSDAHETTVTVVDPTADRTITLPDATGTVITTGNLSSITSLLATDIKIGEDDNTKIDFGTANAIIFNTDGSERMRMLSDGNIVIGRTSNDLTAAGCSLEASGTGAFIRSGGPCVILSRLTNDGEIIRLDQGGTTEGTISVSGSTISYNAFSGSHWSRLADNSKPTILRGTVMETIDEMCDWYQAEYTSQEDIITKDSIALPEGKKVGDTITHTVDGVDYTAKILQETDYKHPKCKISDTADCTNVYGVFLAWDSDDDAVNDMYVNAVGTNVIRIHKDQTVSKGDLLTSNGDGTAKKQDDDIIRSKTIGKVLSNKKQETYSDGSYVVPCALYCG